MSRVLATPPPGQAPRLGVFDNFWGGGTSNNAIFLGNFLPPVVSSPTVGSSNVLGGTGGQSVSVTIGSTSNQIFVNTNILSLSNVTVQYVFIVDNNNPNNDSNGVPQMDVRFEPSGDFSTPVIRWTLPTVDPSGQPVTNTLFLTDAFVQPQETNAPSLVTNGFSASGEPQLAPTNYTFSTTFNGFDGLPMANATFDPNVLADNAFSTNPPFSANIDFSLWGVNLQDVTFRPEPLALNQSFSNIPGRIEITADQSLDLTRAHITGPNYLNVTSTNHFVGAANAQIVFPFASFNLGSTNGQLTITNLVAPFITRVTGPIDVWSAKWTNLVMSNIVDTSTTNVTTNAITITNRFHVLLVNSTLNPIAGIGVENFSLRSTNVVISDVLQVQSNLLINAQNLTVTSNDPSAQWPTGQILLLSGNILWSPSLPILQNLTNAGVIDSFNTIFFDHRASPTFASPSDTPYVSFYNSGSITSSGGVVIWAGNFTDTNGVGGNGGLIEADQGPLTVQANNALLVGGTFDALFGDITIASGNLTISNQSLTASQGALILNVTNQLTDGGAIGNLFQIADGVNLPIKPASGGLLGTTMMIQCPAGAEVDNVWAGTDLGAVPAGYSNNAAVGHLVLSGGDVDSAFHFVAAGAQNALYVDQLEFQGATSNATALDIDPNMKIYFASALSGGTDISGLLDGANGGSIRKVPGFTGLFKVGSSPGAMQLSITVSNLPPMSAMISWQAAPNATNGLYSSASVNGSGWTLVTNLVQGATSSVVTVPQPIQANGPLFYKVRINPIGH